MHRCTQTIFTGWLAIIYFGIAGCATPVLVDYDREAALKFHYYKCFVVDTPEIQENAEDLFLSSIVNRRFASELSNSLKLRGFVDNCHNPDFRVRFNLSKQTVTDMDLNYPGNLRFYRYNNFYPNVGFFPSPYFDRHEEGTFLIDIIDAESEELVWRGTYTERLGSQALGEDEIRTIIDYILDRFPPEEMAGER